MPSYKRPPITEVVLEFRYAQPTDKETIEKAGRRLKSLYTHLDNENEAQVTLPSGNEAPRVSLTRWAGSKFSSSDRADLLILRPRAFVCSRLAPYPGWEAFSDRAKRDWDIWKGEAGVQQFKRFGLRYINRIDVPKGETPNLQILDYLNVAPKLPDNDPALILNYSMHVVRMLGVDECGVILNSGSVASPLVNHISFTLDIDVYRDKNLPIREDEMWSLIGRMRIHKNQIFESCVTDNSRRLFDK